jgi:hypothetical protein
MSTPTRSTSRRLRRGARVVSVIVTLVVIALYVLVLTRGQLPIHLESLVH